MNSTASGPFTVATGRFEIAVVDPDDTMIPFRGGLVPPDPAG